MIPTHVTILPAGSLESTRNVETTSDIRVIDEYCRILSEVLDEYGISHSILKRGSKLIRTGAIVVIADLGWFTSDRKRNRSEVYFGTHGSKKLALLIADTLGEWGRCSSFGHVAGNAKETSDDMLETPGTVSVRVQPFSLNGPNFRDYHPRLTTLARDLAMALIEFLKSQNEKTGYRPLTVAAASGK